MADLLLSPDPQRHPSGHPCPLRESQTRSPHGSGTHSWGLPARLAGLGVALVRMLTLGSKHGCDQPEVTCSTGAGWSQQALTPNNWDSPGAGVTWPKVSSDLGTLRVLGEGSGVRGVTVGDLATGAQSPCITLTAVRRVHIRGRGGVK